MAYSNRYQAAGHMGENQEYMSYRKITVRQYPG